MDDPHFFTEFQNEILLMSKLHHRNIVAFYGGCCADPDFVMITEWMAKGRLLLLLLLFLFVFDDFFQFV